MSPVPPSPKNHVSAELVVQRLRSLRNRRGVDYVAPSEPELAAYRAWLSKVCAGATSAQAPVGFLLEPLERGASAWLLREAGDKRRGAGVVLIDGRSDAAPLIVEAPHTFFDAGTLEIAASVFATLRARALLINTVHRTGGGDGESGGDGDDEARGELARSRLAHADLAHTESSFYLAAHQALLEAYDNPATLQIHGFRDEIGDGARVIVSAARSTADARAVAEALRPLLGADGVRTYPDQVRLLGGTTNVQARASAVAGAPFIHLELSRSVRDELLRDARLLERVARALAVVSSSGRR
jgi:hypothetical protein